MSAFTNNSWDKYIYNTTINNITTTTTYQPEFTHYNISIYPTLSPPQIYVPTVVVSSNDSSFYTYGYYYLILLALLILAGVWAKIAAQRRQQAVRAALNQRLRARQANTTVTTISDGRINANEEANNSNNTQPKDADLPPAYDEVMQTYINAKLELQAQEESEAAGGMSTAESSITIETEVDITASANDLTVTTTTAATTTTTRTVSPEAPAQPPPYEDSTAFRNNNNTNNIV